MILQRSVKADTRHRHLSTWTIRECMYEQKWNI